MRVLVCGGRDFHDVELLHRTLFAAHERARISLLIEGGAPGADAMARVWAQHSGIHTATVPALWDRYHSGAGPLRNQAMLELKPDLVIAFPGENGTAHMVRLAKAAGVRVQEVTP